MFFPSKQFRVPYRLETVQTSARILLVSIPAATCLSRSRSVRPSVCSSLTCSPDVNIGRHRSISPAPFDFLRIRLLCLQAPRYCVDFCIVYFWVRNETLVLGPDWQPQDWGFGVHWYVWVLQFYWNCLPKRSALCNCRSSVFQRQTASLAEPLSASETFPSSVFWSSQFFCDFTFL